MFGNGEHGVLIGNATGNLVQGNVIGATPGGDADLGNTGVGVRLTLAPTAIPSAACSLAQAKHHRPQWRAGRVCGLWD
ncbi:MAG: hypothetical protein KIS63_09320 [Caldilineales bacterium]|nr:hypothetical protein [Caldilineales bacterium]